MILVAGFAPKAVVHSYNLETEELDTVIEDKQNECIPDIGVHDEMVYYIRRGNGGKAGTLCRFPVDNNVHATDDCRPASTDPGVKKFDFGADGMAYAVTSVRRHIIVTVQDSRTAPSPPIQNLPDCVAMKVGRGPGDEEIIYVATKGVDALTGQAGIATISLHPIRLESD